MRVRVGCCSAFFFAMGFYALSAPTSDSPTPLLVASTCRFVSIGRKPNALHCEKCGVGLVPTPTNLQAQQACCPPPGGRGRGGGGGGGGAAGVDPLRCGEGSVDSLDDEDGGMLPPTPLPRLSAASGGGTAAPVGVDASSTGARPLPLLPPPPPRPPSLRTKRNLGGHIAHSTNICPVKIFFFDGAP